MVYILEQNKTFFSGNMLVGNLKFDRYFSTSQNVVTRLLRRRQPKFQLVLCTYRFKVKRMLPLTNVKNGNK